MSDIAKLKKNLQKAEQNEEAAKLAVFTAVDEFGKAAGLTSIAREELENAEALEMARDLRQKKV